MNYLSIEIFFILTFAIFALILIIKTNKITIIEFIKKPYLIALLIIFTIGVGIRIIGIEKYPIFQDIDEINIGYDTYAIANYGVDRFNLQLPVHLIGRGSGQNALYAYLSVPFVKLFGLNLFSTRILNSVISSITLLFIIYLLSKTNIKDDKIKIIILLLAIINPWHICKSRWGLEANIFPDIVFYAVTFIYTGIKSKKIRYYFIGSIILSIATYSYGTSYVFIPVFSIITFIYLIIKKYIKVKIAILNIILMLLIQIPILSFIYINNIKGDTYKYLNTFTVPKLYTNRMEDKSNISYDINSKLKIISKTFNIIYSQNDQRLVNSIDDYGLIYRISIPFIIIGLVYSFKSKNELLKLNIIFLISAFIMSINLNPPNINRLNILWIPLIILLINGVINIYKSNKLIGYILVAVYIMQFIMFANFYFGEYQNKVKVYKNNNIIEIFEFTKNLKYENLYITTDLHQSFSYYLFVNKPNPKEWNEKVIRKDGIKDYYYIQYNNVYFYLGDNIIKNNHLKEDNNVYIITYDEYKKFNIKNKNIKYFENYLIIY